MKALEAMGVAPEVLEEMRAALDDADKRATLAVRPEIWHALQAFLAMETQWNVAFGAFGGERWIGLHYASLPLVLASLRGEIPERCRQPLSVLRPQIKRMELAAAGWRNTH